MEPEDKEDSAAKLESLTKYLLSEVSGALKREKNWRKSARTAVKIYEAGEVAENSYNILFSNTDTLAPSLYNSLPRPDVKRRYKDEDPLGLLASKVISRALEYQIDTDLEGKESFDESVTSSVLAALLAGRGSIWVKYDATLTSKPLELPEAAEPSGEEVGETSAQENTEGVPEQSPTYEAVESEEICTEAVPWDRFIHGYGKQWRDVPWVGRIHIMTKDEIKDNYGAEVADLIEYVGKSEDGDKEESDADEKERATTKTEFATVYELWVKRTKKVYFVSPSLPERPLKVVDDPLGLSGFFPCAKPMILVRKLSSLVPTTLYAMYEQQAKELNRITVRINKIIAGLKVRGMYDSTVEGLDKVLEAEDNALIPAVNVAALQQGQTLEKSLWLVPIDKHVSVLQQLYAQRQQVKQVIFEITGIADIMRGSSQASETLGAQQLKNQWGTLRLKRAQREVQRFVRDTLRIIAEVAVTKLSPETLKAMTSLPIPMAEEKAQAQAALQQFQSQPPTPGAPPPQIPPELQMAAMMPSWDDVLGLLQSDVQRSYRIDIETNSTVDLEATEDKQDMGELMNALAQFFNGIAPMVQGGIMPFDAAKAMLLGFVRRYRFGNEVEDTLKQMQAPPPQKPEGEQKSQEAVAAEKAKAEAEIQVAQMELQMKKEEHRMKMEEMQMKHQIAMANHKMALEKAMLPRPEPMGAKSPGVTN